MARSATTPASSTTSRSGQTSSPRIFHVLPQAVPADDWPRLLRDCAALGFDTVMIAPPFATGTADNVWLTSDHQRLHSSLLNAAGDDNPRTWLRNLADLCAQHGLLLWLDWVVGRFDGEAPIVTEHPEWFRPLDQTDAPDPRVVRRQRAGCMAVTADAGGLLSSWWAPQLDAWRETGISGLCCHSPEALSATAWRALLQRVHNQSPDFRCLAWTPGLPAKQAAALGDAGFDLAACSLPWWDGRSAWLGAELANLRRHFPAVVAPLAARDESPLSTGEAEIERRRQLRKLTCATALADGWLLPMGLERGRPWSTMGPGTAAWDMRAEVAAANASFADAPTDPTAHWECLSEERENPGAWLERRRTDAKPSRLLLLNNDDQHLTRVDLRSLRAVAACGAAFAAARTATDQDASKTDEVVLEAGEAQLLWAHERAPICTPPRAARPSAAMLSAPRIAIESPRPSVANGRFAARRSVGETVEITADVFCDGHDMIAAAVAWRGADETQWRRVRMSALGNDRFAARIALSRVGMHEFTIEAWIDRYGSYRQALEKKHAAGAVARADIDEGRALVGAAIDRAEADADADDRADAELHKLRTALRKPSKDVDAIEALLAPRTAALMQTHDARVFLTIHPATPLRIEAERRAARFASWYELFPRSQANDQTRHGRFDDVIARLPDIADLGFDVLYMTPIHPIGQTKRKGRNNAASANADDVGSPYAIGAADGGHDAVHRELGTLEDFQRLREAAAAHGMELALDFAIQCSPDHPWIGEHPEWFQWRSDGHIRHAENPPKVYEDIVNVDFYAAAPAQAALWKALRDVVLFWVRQGVRLFRVDNPHTKPFPFWEWMIGDVRARHPDVVFLAEAFTRPKPMYRLARLGFSQSYTYFTWRNAKQELQDYFTELCTGEPREYFCPHLFVNTPDINPFFLQHSGRSGFLIRTALACCLSGLWGMYSGFELCEAAPLEGREEYLDSEKYQLRARDWNAAGNIRAEIRQLNQLRRDHVELQTHLGLAFYAASDPNVLYFAKRAPGRESMLLIAINLDPRADHASSIEVPLWEWKRPDDAAAGWHDLLDDRRGRWVGKVQQIFLPAARPYAIWRIQPENA